MSNCHLNGYPKQFLINVLYLNPFPKIKIKKNPKFHFVKIQCNTEKEMEPCKSTAEEVSFE